MTEKIEREALVQLLLKQGKTYKEIQRFLKKRFGQGMSNTTLGKIRDELDELEKLREENERLKHELALYKNMYFEIVEAMKKPET